MKVLVLFVLASCLVLASSAYTRPDFSLSRTDTREMFAEWSQFYGKTYETAIERELRYYNFVANMERSRALNEQHGADGLFGITKFSDLSKAEFEDKYLMPKEMVEQLKQSKATITVDDAAKLTNPLRHVITDADGNKLTPSFQPNTTYDWQYSGYTTAVKNQEQCGSCWAFSATEQIESNWAMKNSLPPALSPQQIVDCDTQAYGCGGGWPYWAYTYVQSAQGLETDAQYPYTAVQGTCMDKTFPKTASITGYQNIAPGNESGMFTFLQTGGPISICLNANNLETYTGNNQILPGSTCTDSVNHCIQLTGFRTDGTGNIEAWNVRNSWGADWGNAGYAFLQYGVNACNINSSPTIVTV